MMIERRSYGERKRADILGRAIDLSTVRGLDGLSLGGLAREVGMSKSGIFAHFGSKQDLQVAVLETAAQAFASKVLGPAAATAPGLERLRALIDGWFDYVSRVEYQGGCFFAATSSEFSNRPGPVRDALVALMQQWLRALETDARVAVRQREFHDDTDPATLAFQLHAYVQEANWARELLGDSEAFAKARVSIDAALAAATASDRR